MRSDQLIVFLIDQVIDGYWRVGTSRGYHVEESFITHGAKRNGNQQIQHQKAMEKINQADLFI